MHDGQLRASYDLRYDSLFFWLASAKPGPNMWGPIIFKDSVEEKFPAKYCSATLHFGSIIEDY